MIKKIEVKTHKQFVDEIKSRRRAGFNIVTLGGVLCELEKNNTFIIIEVKKGV